MKKVLCLLLSALLLIGTLSLTAFASSDTVVYMSYTADDSNDGLTPQTPKRGFGAKNGNGVMALLQDGGTLVVVGKSYVGAARWVFNFADDVTITSNYGGVDYKNAEPVTNPSCAFKIKEGGNLIIESNVTFDDIILFEEGKQVTITVAEGAKLTITDKAVLMSKPGTDHHYRIVVEEGATACLSVEAQMLMDIECDGTLETYSAEAETPAEKFKATRTYANEFTDVAENQWFYSYVKTAYEYALANGTSANKFSPDGTFTVAQALTAAVNIHKAYNGTTVRTAASGEAWYTPYVEYCVEKGIITANQFADYNKNITRGEMAIVFANILPESEYASIRTYTLSDMNDTLPSAAAVKKLANAGIVGGSNGKFNPNDDIKRSEACVIFTRIAVASMRDSKTN